MTQGKPLLALETPRPRPPRPVTGPTPPPLPKSEPQLKGARSVPWTWGFGGNYKGRGGDSLQRVPPSPCLHDGVNRLRRGTG